MQEPNEHLREDVLGQSREEASADSNPTPSTNGSPPHDGRAAVDMPPTEEKADTGPQDKAQTKSKSLSECPSQDKIDLTPSYSHSAPFWQTPLPEKTYMQPPYGLPELRLLERQVLAICEYLNSAGFKAECQELLYQLYTHILPAYREYEQVRHEQEPKRAELERQIREIRAELAQTEEEFFAKLAEARLPVPLPPPNKKSRRSDPPPCPQASPETVEKALHYAFAERDEICGEQGIVPPRDYKKGGLFAQLAPIGTFLMELAAPLTAGLLLGVNIGVITGFLTLDDLINLRNLTILLLAASIGFVVEKMGGYVYYSLSESIAQALERRAAPQGTRPVPSLKGFLPISVLVLLALALGVSMVTVDALGLRMLHEEAIRQMQLEGMTSEGTFPFWVYILVGMIVSMPYLIYKAVRGWRNSEVRQREAHLAYHAWQHIEDRRKEEPVRKAFRLGAHAVTLREQLAKSEQKLETIKALLDSARTQAIGSHQQFQSYLERLMQFIRNHHHYDKRATHFNSRPVQKPTLLNRLLNWFRR